MCGSFLFAIGGCSICISPITKGPISDTESVDGMIYSDSDAGKSHQRLSGNKSDAEEIWKIVNSGCNVEMVKYQTLGFLELHYHHTKKTDLIKITSDFQADVNGSLIKVDAQRLQKIILSLRSRKEV
jgi:hypothetical protein